MISDQYQEWANQVISLIKKDFILNDGQLSISRDLQGKKSTHHIWPDLGDWLPFFLYFGEEKFVDNQMSFLPIALRDDLLVSDFKFIKIKNWSKSYEYTDFLLGLLDYHLHKKDQESFNLFIKHLKKFIFTFYSEKKQGSFYQLNTKILLPIIDTRDATVIEILLAAYEWTNQEWYLQQAIKITDLLFANDFFYKYKLLPNFFSKNVFLQKLIGKRFSRAQICKNNTNTLSGLLALWQKTKDQKYQIWIEQIISSIFSQAVIDNIGVVYTFFPGKKNDSAHLTASFAMLDFLCDYYQASKQFFILERAKKLADYWLALRGKTGLFPENSKLKCSYLDSETDMTVAMYKLFEITNEEKYFQAAEDCFAGLIKYHLENDFPLRVDIESGEVMNSAQKTKYLTLFLKLLILKDKLEKGVKIYDNKVLFDLLKDR